MNPSINKKIFKSYDVRGIYPGEINEEVAYEIGKTLADLTEAEKFVVGRDMRLGSPDLHRGLIRGLTEKGVEVHDIGLVPIDAVYFATGRYSYGGGAMITASHNPKEYAGLKMVGKNFKWIRGGELLKFMEENFENIEKPSAKKGVMKEVNIFPEYLRHILSFVDEKKLKPLKVVIDAGNGMAGKVIPLLFEKLPFKVIPLFFELDGNFPNHPSNPLEPESQIAVTKKVREEKADCGVIIDGDTDRLFFIDENGKFIRADMTLLLLTEEMLKKYPGSGIAYNLICSKTVPEWIVKMGGRPLRSAVGFVNVATAMREGGGVLGGELSAHYSFKDNFCADSGFIALLLVLQILSESEKPLSEIVKRFMIYAKSDEVNLPITDAPSVIKKVKGKYGDGRQDELDGLTVEYPDWWFNVRPSNTEPLLRVTIEADTEGILKKNKKELIEFINNTTKNND